MPTRTERIVHDTKMIVRTIYIFERDRDCVFRTQCHCRPDAVGWTINIPRILIYASHRTRLIIKIFTQTPIHNTLVYL